jgi:delta-aminolevulinic acid dehydratase/porphobilinogen synthase
MEWTHTYVIQYTEEDTVETHNIYKGRKILWPQKKLFMEHNFGENASYYELFHMAMKNPDITWVGPKFSYLDVVEHRETKRRFLIHNISWSGSYSEPTVMFMADDIDCHIVADSHFAISNNKAEDYELIAYFDFEKDKFEYIKEFSIEDKVKIEKLAFC